MGGNPNRRNLMLKPEHIKMGRLVRLSYYGRTLKSNPEYTRGDKGKLLLGVITKIDSTQKYPMYVTWFHPNTETVHSVSELKNVKQS